MCIPLSVSNSVSVSSVVLSRVAASGTTTAVRGAACRLLNEKRKSPDREKTGRSSSKISSTRKAFLAFLTKFISALLRFLKQKYTTASGLSSSRSLSVCMSNGKAGSKYTHSAAMITLGFCSMTAAGSGSPLR